MGNITFKQYRNIDLSIIAILLVISETITTIATNKWFYAQPIAITTTFLFICIGMMRWSGFSTIYAILGGLVFCIASGANPEQYLIYIVGNLFTLLSLLWFIPFKKEDVRKGGFKLVLFTVSAYLMMQVGRWIVALFFGAGFSDLIGFLTSDIITLLFGVVLMFVLRNVDGMIEDQKAYLFRLQREREAENAAPTELGWGEED